MVKIVEKLNAWHMTKSAQVSEFRKAIKTNDEETLRWLKANAMDYLPPSMVDTFIKNVNKRLNN